MVAIAPTQTLRPLTYDDLAAMPDDGKRYEIINGELSELTGPTPKHQTSSLRMVMRLEGFVTTHKLGQVFYSPLDVYFTPHDVVQPDIIYISRERRGIIRERRIEGAPDLLMEILSPSNRLRDIITKAALYATMGVPEYWLVDPELETIKVHTLRNNVYVLVEPEGDTVRSLVIPGFSLRPEDIFATSDWMQSDDA
jgi:Uma2 family endonuclease